jgi:plasmid stabilization system protein ParE
VRSVEFAPEARAELDAAADQYEEQRSGRGVRFYAAIERTVKLIMRLPTVGPMYRGVQPELGVRCRIVSGFPFTLAYRVRGEVIRIDAVAHMRRRPGYWHQRVG